MKYDQFEFNTAIKEMERKNGFYMVLKIYINGVDLSGEYEIRDDHFVDSLETTKLANTREYCIVACSCGNPECVGIYTGIQVTHFEDCILWQVPNPLSKYDLPKDERDGIEGLPVLWRYDAYRFEREAFILAARIALGDVHSYNSLATRPAGSLQ